MNVRKLEKLLGFKTPIKWSFSIKVIAYHVIGVWWICNYAFPAKLLTIFFFLLMYSINIFSNTCGLHRLLAHRCYKVKTPLKILLLLGSASAAQNSAFQWIRDHRLHHKHSDTDADPHNVHRGLFFSHMGWLMTARHDEVLKKGKSLDMSDIVSDKHVMFFHRHAALFNIIFSFTLPTITGIYLWDESWKCAVAWQCFLRPLCIVHAALALNSVNHNSGYTPYNTNIRPGQNRIMSAITFGEGWHNYHHMFPFDYKAAEFIDDFNLSARLIKFFEKMGWAYDLKEASPELIKSVREKHGDGVLRIGN